MGLNNPRLDALAAIVAIAACLQLKLGHRHVVVPLKLMGIGIEVEVRFKIANESWVAQLNTINGAIFLETGWLSQITTEPENG